MHEGEKKTDRGWMDYRALCSELAISRSTAERLVSQGMPHLKINRLVRFDLRRVLEWLGTAKA